MIPCLQTDWGTFVWYLPWSPLVTLCCSVHVVERIVCWFELSLLRHLSTRISKSWHERKFKLIFSRFNYMNLNVRNRERFWAFTKLTPFGSEAIGGSKCSRPWKKRVNCFQLFISFFCDVNYFYESKHWILF